MRLYLGSPVHAELYTVGPHMVRLYIDDNTCAKLVASFREHICTQEVEAPPTPGAPHDVLTNQRLDHI